MAFHSTLKCMPRWQPIRTNTNTYSPSSCLLNFASLFFFLLTRLRLDAASRRIAYDLHCLYHGLRHVNLFQVPSLLARRRCRHYRGGMVYYGKFFRAGPVISPVHGVEAALTDIGTGLLLTRKEPRLPPNRLRSNGPFYCYRRHGRHGA